MKKPKQPKPVKVDKDAPKSLVLEVTLPFRHNKPSSSYGTIMGGLRVFTTGGFGYNFSGKLVNPASGETYTFSGNLVLVGSTPKKKAKK